MLQQPGDLALISGLLGSQLFLLVPDLATSESYRGGLKSNDLFALSNLTSFLPDFAS